MKDGLHAQPFRIPQFTASLLPAAVTLVILSFLGLAGCNPRYSSAAFRLPADADQVRGKTAFVALGCNSCHEVAGVELPRPADKRATPVVLGGSVDQRLSDAFLAAKLIDPSFRVQNISSQQPRMPHRLDDMSVRQLTDIVAFLQAHYSEREIHPSVYR